MTNGRSGAVEKKMHPSPLKNWHPFPPGKFQQPKNCQPHTPLKKSYRHTPPKKKNSSQKDNLG